MKIAITSGKGGVGKTFVATCLASALAKTQPVTYIDCDVEAPNAHLFLKPTAPQTQTQTLNCIEGVDPEKCTWCGQCARACYFNALVVGKNNAMAFPELCRGAEPARSSARMMPCASGNAPLAQRIGTQSITSICTGPRFRPAPAA